MAKKEKGNYAIGEVFDERLAMLPTNEIMDTMESVCYNVTEGGYSKILSEKDLIEKKELLAETSILIAELDEQKKEQIKAFKEKLEGPLAEKKELLSAIKFKTEFKNGTLFHVDDQENGLMYVFDEQAVCVDVRPLRNSEKQVKIKILKTGTNGE